MLNSRNFRVGIRLVGNTTLTGSVLGDLQSYTVDGQLYYNDGVSNKVVLTESGSNIVTNKKLDDSTVFFVDTGDITKEFHFDAAGTTGTKTTLASSQTANRVLTLPDATDTIVGRATTDTLTNKSISGLTNTITNVSLTTGVTGTLPIANGGTGQVTASAAFDALSPMTTGGDIIYGGASGTGTRLPNGAAGQVLTSAGTTLAPTWSTPSPGFVNPMTTIGDIIVGGVGGTATRLGATTNGFILTLSGGSPVWAANAGGSAVQTIGVIDSQAKSANGLVITGTSLVAQTADVSFPGMVSTGSQSFAGTKIFAGAVQTNTINGNTNDLMITSTPARDIQLTSSGTGNITTTVGGAGNIILTGPQGLHLKQVSASSTPASTYDNMYFKSNDLLYAKNSSGVETQVGSFIDSAETMTQVTTPANPSAGHNKFYFKSDNNMYFLNSSGVETIVGAAVPVNSYVTCDSAASTTGSTGTNIRYFTNATTVGTAITRTASSINGDSFTINEDGIYSVDYSDQNGVSASIIGISKNASTTTPPQSLTAANRLGISALSAAGNILTVSGTFYAIAGDTIRAQVDATSNWATDNRVSFRIVKIAVQTGNISPFKFYTSSQVSTLSSTIAGSTFTTFSNSPALSFTPTVNGTYKVYSPANILSTGTGGGVAGRIFNTTGGATLLSENPGVVYSNNSTAENTVTLMSTYTLIAGTPYVFDIQGRNISATGVQLDGSNFGPFYMFAELCG